MTQPALVVARPQVEVNPVAGRGNEALEEASREDVVAFVIHAALEDIGHVQHSEAIKNLLGACRVPDPTTAGDFLRRFEEQEHFDALTRVLSTLS